MPPPGPIAVMYPVPEQSPHLSRQASNKGYNSETIHISLSNTVSLAPNDMTELLSPRASRFNEPLSLRSSPCTNVT